jgi:hypothetical protein
MLSRFRAWTRPLIVDRTSRILLVAAAAFVALAWAMILWRLLPLIARGRVISLHYSIYLGVNAVGPAWQALVLPALGTAVFIANTVLIRLAYSRESRSAALVLAVLTSFLELLVFVGCGYIILINVRI